MRRLLLMLIAAAAIVTPAATARTSDRVEVIELSGIVDGSVEHSVLATLDQAEREVAKLVIVQIDSRGVLEQKRMDRIVARIRVSPVPIATWVGPPGARAQNGAALIAMAGHIRAMAPGAKIGPILTFDMRGGPIDQARFQQSVGPFAPTLSARFPYRRAVGARVAQDQGLVDHVEPSILDVIGSIDGTQVMTGARKRVRISIDTDQASIRFHKLDLFGRMLHAAAQPSITYLLLLLGLVGVVFELFHPSNGPAGLSGLFALALAVFGATVLGASWFGFGLIVVGVACFAIDLRFASLGPFSAAGSAGLVAGSVLLFGGPWLRVSPLILLLGVAGMVAFLLGAMTRVLRDLRAIARGELEVQDAHQHPDDAGGEDAP